MKQITHRILLGCALCLPALFPSVVRAALSDTLPSSPPPRLSLSLRGAEHRLEVTAVPTYVFPTHRYLQGENDAGRSIRWGFGARLRYAFRYAATTVVGRLYGCPEQGIGVGVMGFGEPRLIGKPVVVQVFQSALLARLSPRLTLRYAWNLGLSFGWKTYDADHNPHNRVIGSPVNAAIGLGLYLDYCLSPHWSLRPGVELNHYSNGNTAYPNAGLNTAGLRLGVAYRLKGADAQPPAAELPSFKPHFSYDLTVFGSWRRKNYFWEGRGYVSPHKYGVVGLRFAPMYNVSRRFRFGLSFDGLYDVSANMRRLDDELVRGSAGDRFALGLSAAAEYVMPFFTVGFGYGRNVLCGSSDLRAWYQMLTLKASLTRSTYLHIGYSLEDFKEPNYLMLGVGFRFNNRSPLPR